MDKVTTGAPAVAKIPTPPDTNVFGLDRKAIRFAAVVLVAAVSEVAFGTAAAACSVSNIRPCTAAAQRGDSDAIRVLAVAIKALAVAGEHSDGDASRVLAAAIRALGPAAGRGDSDAIRALQPAVANGNAAAIRALGPAAGRGDSDAIRVLENAIKTLEFRAASGDRRAVAARSAIHRLLAE